MGGLPPAFPAWRAQAPGGRPHRGHHARTSWTLLSQGIVLISDLPAHSTTSTSVPLGQLSGTLTLPVCSPSTLAPSQEHPTSA